MKKLLTIKRELVLMLVVLIVGIYIVTNGHTNLVTGFMDCDNTVLHSHIRCEM